ncbi:hypothetical protein B0T26DRAFT_671509 [Lasiosphaeria miniovina]|uniref:DUF6536 domain-containing protein n=1 Tax=Lasiosphaeria miniovina TaxID=1954250 RepID=A0AA40B300_9PEZI|nr:uncharacterized protein B0T26DRAFT_671509 [Lasiosphaeria miniovina]KAK0726745.1 hypothetical protein B0T26DRAFT_671509 [Lasiosphaeria miniovina]
MAPSSEPSVIPPKKTRWGHICARKEMKCLSSPTRSEVDRAHARGKWLEIGVPSTRNIGSISLIRGLLWFLLLLSSLPLHFLDYYDAGTLESIDDDLRSLQCLASTDQLQNLTSADCIDAYGTPFLTSLSDVVLVIGQLHDNATLERFDAAMPHSQDLNRPAPRNPQRRGRVEAPIAGNHTVAYCLSKQEEEYCKVNFSIVFAAIVVAANAVKVTVLVITLLNPPQEPLLVLGDAIASFLTRPNLHSAGIHWGSAARLSQWFVNLVLIRTTSGKALIAFVEPSSSKSSMDALALRVVVANTPHVIFSIFYFRYNSMFTRMLAAREWSGFGVKRKSLRLPYRFGVPLLMFSVLMHWLMSQSLFVVAVESPNDVYNDDNGWYLITCGYSPMAIILVLALCCFLVAAVVVAGFCRLPSAITVVGSCSFAIAAACHSPGEQLQPQPDSALAPLQWGVIILPDFESSKGQSSGHCSFSAEEVGEPEEGCRYGRVVDI